MDIPAFEVLLSVLLIKNTSFLDVLLICLGHHCLFTYRVESVVPQTRTGISVSNVGKYLNVKAEGIERIHCNH